MRKLDVFCFANFQQGWRSEDDVYSFANSVLSGYWVSLLVIGLKTDSVLLRVSVISCRKSQQQFVIEMAVWITWLCGKCWPLLTFLTLFAFCYLHFEALHSNTAALIHRLHYKQLVKTFIEIGLKNYLLKIAFPTFDRFRYAFKYHNEQKMLAFWL